MSLISRVYSMAYGPAPTGRDADERNHAMRQQAWHKMGLAVLDPENIADDWLRQAVINETNRQYGRRKGA